MEQIEYKALAIKYRPRVFKHVLAQSHIKIILENAIKMNKFHHAYVMTGTRGVGKTTIARIIAKSLNCFSNRNNQSVFEPCLTCDNCISIENSRHQDILEIDAASHTGISDIKEIIESSKYKPINARYKIYIIDEVHMLSNSAFNALLKILEEPSKHVKFILATTEIKKIPLTILSRCQRLDLHRIDIKDLTEYIKKICQKEGFKISTDNALIISRAAQGSVRDALSMLDQAILTCNDHSEIKSDLLNRMLGVVNSEYLCKLFYFIISDKVQEALDIVRNLYDMGAEPYLILQSITEICHKIVLCKINYAQHYPLSDNEMMKYSEIAEKISLTTITRFWQIFNKCLLDIKASYNPIITLEMILIQACHIHLIITPEEILKNSSKYHFSMNNIQNTIKEKNLYLNTIEELFLFLEQKMEMLLLCTIKNDLSIIEFKRGYIKIEGTHNLKLSLNDLKLKMQNITGLQWIIEIDPNKKGINYAQKEKEFIVNKKALVQKEEMVQSVLKTFPGTKINDIKLSNI